MDESLLLKLWMIVHSLKILPLLPFTFHLIKQHLCLEHHAPCLLILILRFVFMSLFPVSNPIPSKFYHFVLTLFITFHS